MAKWQIEKNWEFCFVQSCKKIYLCTEFSKNINFLLT